jgi:sugar lactone lactonase YvrE
MAVDADGNLYIADTSNDRIRRVTAGSGILSTVVGKGSRAFSGDGGAATAAEISLPFGLASDSAGNLYIADRGNSRIRKVAAGSGIITTVAGDGSRGFGGDGGAATAAGLNFPEGVALDSTGNLYIADTFNARLRKVAAGSGIITTVAGNGVLTPPDSNGTILGGTFSGDGGPATAAGLSMPSGVAVDASGNVYIADSYNNRIRKVTAGSGIITTVAGIGPVGNGHGSISGDGGSATAAALNGPSGVALDPAGNLFIADTYNSRIRKVVAGSGIITTISGNGSFGFSGDGGAAAAARLNYPAGVALDSAGNLYIADDRNSRIRKVAAGSGIITTIAGNGSDGFSGDGDTATAAGLAFPYGVALDLRGNLYIADFGTGRIRRVSIASKIITTVAGNGSQGFSGDGGAATAAALGNVSGVAVDSAGNLYIADANNSRIRRVIAGSGIITTVAGNGSQGFSGDGGDATLAGLNFPGGVALDSAGNLYIADIANCRIRRVAAASGIITTVVGNGSCGFGGDGGAATAAELNNPRGVALDSGGNLYVADTDNCRIRSVDGPSGIIRTVVGNGLPGFSGDGGAATTALLYYPEGIALDPGGNLYIADTSSGRIRRVASESGIIATVAGNGLPGFSGDGGAATAARVNYPEGVVLDLAGNLYIADPFNSRVRVVPACVTVPSSNLQVPSNGSISIATAPLLAWNPSHGALHYDVYLDTLNPPQTIVAADVAAATYNPSNLEPLTAYYWKVVAKGDPFCTPFSTASSNVFSFTTTGSCETPAPVTGNALSTATGATISWQPSARASSYDIYLGASSPPRLYAQNVSGTTQTVNGLASGTTYNWKIVAHASCDAVRTAETSIGSFTTSGACGVAASFSASAPNDGDATVPSTATLSWQASPGAASYDLYLGSGSNPPLYMNDLEQTSVVIARLSPGAEYTWRVVAKAACDATKSTASPVRHFTVASCGAPSPPAVSATQANASAGATYSVRWSDAIGLDSGGSYLVERATDSAFTSILDHQQTTATSASFVSKNAGTYYHRISAIAGCNLARRSAPSETVQVTVAPGAPEVVFSVLPQAVITKLGDKLEDQKTSFALENLGSTTVQVLVGPQLTGSIPFFTIVDPFGGDSSFVMLEPHKAKSLDIHYSGPPNDQPGTYQGGIYVMSTGTPLAFTPQAYVNLKVGGDANAIAPKLLVNGLESEFVYFPSVTGDDAARPPIQVDLLNSGTVPMEVAGEIGPEAWLKMEKDWNGMAVQASSFRTLRLSTQRTKAVAGSALPRYTYLTVRNKSGQSARLLVEDSGGVSTGSGRTSPLGAGEMSSIVPYVTGGTAVLMTNSGSDQVPADLIFTPEGSDGFDATAVLRASIVVPPNDVVSLTDPLAQIFGKNADATGSIEIRSPKLAQLAVRAEGRKTANGGGAYGVAIPIAMRGEGARLDSSHRVAGITSNGSTKTSLVLTETSGREKTTAHVALYDDSGSKRGEQTIDLGRYGTRRIDDIAQALAGGASITAGRLDLEVTAGGGAVLAIAIATDRTSGAGAAIVGHAVTNEIHLASLGRPVDAAATSPSQTVVVPGVITDNNVRTTIGISATASPVNATIAFRETTIGQATKQSIVIAAGRTGEVDIAARKGTATIVTDAPAAVYARVRGTNIADALPVVSSFSEGLTGGGSSTPLYADGLEHSIDATRGRKTSLILTEVAGQSATVNVRLYEPGSRPAPVAEKDFTIAANSELRLDNLFVTMGLESGPDDLDQRRKNQINIAAVITTTSGNGVIAAEALMTDNKTGDRRTIQFVPAGNVPATTSQRSAITTTPPTRRRAVGR